jgi:carboxylesterase type B
MPAQTIKSIIETNQITFSPVTDNFTVVANAEAKRRTGQIHNFPILVGSNAQEGRVFQRNQNNITKYLETTFPNNIAQQNRVRLAYPVGKDGLNSENDVISQIMTDMSFGCPAAILADDSARAGYPTWRYYFNATFPNLQKFPNAGVYHSSEIELIFGTYGKLNTEVSRRPSTVPEQHVSEFMQSSWAKFAKDPSKGPGSTAWKKVGSVPEDVAVIGQEGLSFIRPIDVDSKCSLFAY